MIWWKHTKQYLWYANMKNSSILTKVSIGKFTFQEDTQIFLWTRNEWKAKKIFRNLEFRETLKFVNWSIIISRLIFIFIPKIIFLMNMRNNRVSEYIEKVKRTNTKDLWMAYPSAYDIRFALWQRLWSFITFLQPITLASLWLHRNNVIPTTRHHPLYPEPTP